MSESEEKAELLCRLNALEQDFNDLIEMISDGGDLARLRFLVATRHWRSFPA